MRQPSTPSPIIMAKKRLNGKERRKRLEGRTLKKTILPSKKKDSSGKQKKQHGGEKRRRYKKSGGEGRAQKQEREREKRQENRTSAREKQKEEGDLQVTGQLGVSWDKKHTARVFLAKGGLYQIANWEHLCSKEEEVVENLEKFPSLPSFAKYGVETKVIYEMLDQLGKVLGQECIPGILRKIPIDWRDRRWLFLNPFTQVVTINQWTPRSVNETWCLTRFLPPFLMIISFLQQRL